MGLLPPLPRLLLLSLPPYPSPFSSGLLSFTHLCLPHLLTEERSLQMGRKQRKAHWEKMAAPQALATAVGVRQGGHQSPSAPPHRSHLSWLGTRAAWKETNCPSEQRGLSGHQGPWRPRVTHTSSLATTPSECTPQQAPPDQAEP